MGRRARLLLAVLLLLAAVAAAVWWPRAPAPARAAAPAAPPVVAPAAEPVAQTEPAPAEAAPAPHTKTVVSASGVRLRLSKRPPLLAPDPPYAGSYALLEPAARAGEVLAQYRLGLLLYECRDVPADGPALEHEVEAVYQTRRRNGFDVDDPRDEEQTLRRRYEECANVPGAARGQYRDWLRRAADAGLIEAQLSLPLHLPAGEWCQYWSECTPQQREKQEALEKEAVKYLGKARAAGSAAALWTFGAWYAEGEALPQNNVEAYAHFKALDEINAAAGQERRFDAMLKDLRGRLRPADLDSAEARARELLANPRCCVLTQ